MAGKRGAWVCIACASVGILVGAFGLGGNRASVGAPPGLMQGDALAREMLARGLATGKLHADKGGDMLTMLSDPSTAWLTLLLSSPSQAAATAMKESLEAQPSRLAERYLKVYAAACMLGYEREKIRLEQARTPPRRTDRQNLEAISFLLGMYSIESDGRLPVAADAAALQAVLSRSPSLQNLPEQKIVADERNWVFGDTHAPIRWNPALSGRRLGRISDRGHKVALYQDPPSPDGRRWVALLDMSTIARVGPAEWSRLRKASGIPGRDLEAPRYRVQTLPGLDGRQEPQPFAVNASGEVAGSATNRNGAYRAVVWRRGRIVDLGVNGRASAINDSGHVWGEQDVQRDRTRFFLWANGRAAFYGSPAEQSVAQDINTRDWCVGIAGAPDGRSRPFLLKSGSMAYLPTLGGAKAAARAINAGGDIAGDSETTAGATHAVLWRGGRPLDLGSLGGNSYALDVNDRGQVVGFAETPYGHFAFTWTNGRMSRLPLPGGYIGSEATAINRWGVVVGSAWTKRDPNQAVMWRDGVMYRLNNCLPPGARLRISLVTGINDRGQIVGKAALPGPRYVERAVLLSPM